MEIYVSGPVSDTMTVQQVQSAVVAAGHVLTLDWSADASFAEGYACKPEQSAKVAQEELDAVLAADALLVVASRHDGRGMFVELGAALTRARCGELDHIVTVGEVHHESVFYFHPLVAGPCCGGLAQRTSVMYRRPGRVIAVALEAA